jgi:GTP-binding protein HflX
MAYAACLIIHPVLADQTAQNRVLSDQIEEVEGLAKAIDLAVLHTHMVKLPKPKPATYLGSGQVEQVRALWEGEAIAKPDLIVFNHTLSPGQQRNLERAWEVKVIDRTALILEIFGARAQTREGKIQVELAALTYQRSRLVRSWTHLERQRGGAGFMGGPGETQLEIDRRLIDQRVSRLKKDLEQVRRTRGLARDQRAKVPFPIVALVGYTNAGKSTLFNRLTGANVLAEDMPFATLDPTMRRLMLPGKQTVILSDTVGFIADLPTQLVAAFRGTLEQVVDADVIVHVRDISAHDTEAQRDEVVKVLSELGVEHDSDPRVVEVLNKIDRLDPDTLNEQPKRAGHPQIAISARAGTGVEGLIAALQKILGQDHYRLRLKIGPDDGKLRAWVHSNLTVLNTKTAKTGIETLDVQADEKTYGQLKARFPNAVKA